MTDVKLGALTDATERDAVHVAILPVVCGDLKLSPGTQIGFSNRHESVVSAGALPLLGIVDPFLLSDVRATDKFWMFLWPNSVTGMRHHWEHPDVDLGTDKDELIREVADACGVSVDKLLQAAGSSYAAANFIDGKYHEKRRKGYRDITHAEFEEMSTEAAIVGSANKCHNMQWVELSEASPDTLEFTAIDEQRLYDPNCNPGLLVELETKKEHDNRNRFKLLFTFEETYDVRDANRAAANQKVEASHPLYDMTKKVEEAIGRRLSAEATA